jgi:hypothetical protein
VKVLRAQVLEADQKHAQGDELEKEEHPNEKAIG